MGGHEKEGDRERVWERSRGEVNEGKGMERENDGRGGVEEKGMGGLWPPPTLAARSAIVDGHVSLL